MGGGVKFLVGVFFFFSQFVFAADPSNWINLHSRDIKIVENARIETKLRLHQIRRAQKTIDIVTYDQGIDPELGKPLLEALRYSADRGVRVRFIRGGLVSKLYNQVFLEWTLKDSVYQTLTQPPTKNPIQYLYTGMNMFTRGWAPTANVHEKLLIIDGRIAFVTGRGQAQAYLNWLDSCYIFKGALVADAQQAFNDLWETVSHETDWDETQFDRTIPDATLLDQLKDFSHDPPLPLSDSDKKRLKRLKRWAQASSDRVISESGESNAQDEVYQARVLHNDVLNQLNENCSGIPWVYNYFSCSSKLKDPVVEEMVSLIRSAREIKFYTLTLVLNPKIKEALVDRLTEATRPRGRNSV